MAMTFRPACRRTEATVGAAAKVDAVSRMTLSGIPEHTLEAIVDYAGPCGYAVLRRCAGPLTASLPPLRPEDAARWPLPELSSGGHVDEQLLMPPATPERKDALYLQLAALTAGGPAATAQELPRLLRIASFRGGAAGVELLLWARAEVNGVECSELGEDHRTPPLLCAVSSGRPAVVRALVHAGARADASRIRRGLYGVEHMETALELACRGGSMEIVELLLKAGADPNGSSRMQLEAGTIEHSPLLVACDHGRPEIFAALLNAGADPDRRCEDPSSKTGTRTVRETLAQMIASAKVATEATGSFAARAGRANVSIETLHSMRESLSNAPPSRTATVSMQRVGLAVLHGCGLSTNVDFASAMAGAVLVDL